MVAYLQKQKEKAAAVFAKSGSAETKNDLEKASSVEAAALLVEKKDLVEIAKKHGVKEEEAIQKELDPAPEFDAEHLKAELELARSKPPTVYTKFDYKNSKPVSGYYFPQFPPKPSTKAIQALKNNMADLAARNKELNEGREPGELVVSNPLPLEHGNVSAVYLPHRYMQRANESLAGKTIIHWDMSRDGKVADYADGQFVVAALEGPSPLYYSVDSGEKFTTHLNSSGVRNWVAVAINYEGERIVAIAKGRVWYDQDTGVKHDGSESAVVLTSSDFGVTWEQQEDASSGHYTHLAVSYDGRFMYIAVQVSISSIYGCYL